MIRSTSLCQLPSFGVKRAAVACGVFDGIHLGHKKIIETLVKTAVSDNAIPVVLTFDPHPTAVLKPNCAPKLLLSRKHQLHLLQNLQVGAAVVLSFTKSLSSLSPEEFVKQVILVSDLQITAFCVGRKWRFGYRASGNTEILKEIGAQNHFGVHTVPEAIDSGAPISSTRVRIALSQGDLEHVRSLLGRNFSILGTVEFGKGIATQNLNYPTANISSDHEIYPPFGVYVANVYLFPKSGEIIKKDGVLYLGESPTFVNSPPEKPFVEIHILNFNRDIYGQTIEVELIQFLRRDLKFNSIESLRDQITDDIKKAKKLLAVSHGASSVSPSS